MRKQTMSVTHAARNLSDCVDRDHKYTLMVG
jgi:hypothetical protein